MSKDLLDDVKVTAERVGRFARDVEDEGSDENRMLWRAALTDFRDAVRRARARGYESQDIEQASRDSR